MTQTKEQYFSAVEFIAKSKNPCVESVALIAKNWGTPYAVVEWDIQQARRKGINLDTCDTLREVNARRGYDN